MQRSKSIRPKSKRLLDREIAEALAKPRSHATRDSTASLSWEGERIPIDPSPRTIKSFELKRPYVVRQGGRLYTVVDDVHRGAVAHPAVVEQTMKSRRAGHAAKKAATPTEAAKAAKAGPSDKITIDQLAKLLGLPDWDRVDEMNQHNYYEMSRGAEDEDAQIEAEQKAQEEIYRQWYDAVEHVAESLFGEHGLEFLAMKNVRRVNQNYRPHVLKIIPTKSWDDAADKLRETINGVGDLHYNNLSEFLKAEAATARQAVLSHLGYIKRYPAVYGGLGANQMYDQAWR